MSQSSGENIVEVKPTFNIYTAMIIISILSLGIATFFVSEALFTGEKYALKEMKQLWEAPSVDKEAIDRDIKIGKTRIDEEEKAVMNK